MFALSRHSLGKMHFLEDYLGKQIELVNEKNDFYKSSCFLFPPKQNILMSTNSFRFNYSFKLIGRDVYLLITIP